MNIWDYKCGDNLKITTTNGKVFTGCVIIINDVDDEDEDYGLKEDSIDMDTDDGRIICFPESEIESIEKLD